MQSITMPAFVLAALASATPCVADPASLLAPDDPSYSSGWRPPPSPTAGLKAIKPAETKDWLQLNRNVTPGASMGGMSEMGGMKGMSGSDMKGMKGMDRKPTGQPPANGPMKYRPGMSGMPGMGSMR